MVYLNSIVAYINSVLQNRLSKYPTADYQGIATYATKVLKTGAIVYPTAIPFGANGAEVIQIDFKLPFNMYHRLGATTFSLGQGYGDDHNSITATTDVQLVVWGVRSKIDTNPEQLAMILSDVLPEYITAPELAVQGFTDIKIIPVGINYDQRNVFAQELQGVSYFIGPELFLFSFRYRIEGSYNKGCLNNCDC